MKQPLKTKWAAWLAFFLLACHAAFPALAATPEDEARYKSAMSEGLALLKAGGQDDLVRAINRFKSALKSKPESAEAYYWMALAFSDQHNYLSAASNAKDATIYDDKLSEAWLLWGQVLLYQKEWKEALDKLETAARLAPDNPVIQFNLGRVYYHGYKDPDSALPRFRAVWQAGATLRRDKPENVPLVVRSRLYMGYCEFERGRWDNAINAFRDVLNEQPGNFEAALRLALCYRRSNRAGECERILWNMRKAIPPENPANNQYLAEINLQLADLYLKDPVLKNSMLATAHLREFVTLSGENRHPALEAAREYLSTHDPE